ncbi:unnamed protein product [Oppiella nova]|uniref:Uncharacterized protein n=1 Tax=Oppiella nova TaxID=334625 RepID=A0A7R9MM81_9ACAR|nr:unnamed protein product [Oppiella nova]CAG2180021.1 unnamed protein product [Oppiella nova]
MGTGYRGYNGTNIPHGTNYVNNGVRPGSGTYVNSGHVGNTVYVTGNGRGSGTGGRVGAAVAGGVIGAAVGAYGGYKLGKMVGSHGYNGNYGYYDVNYRYVKCPPPPKILVDPETKVSYIPTTVAYDSRCHYYDKEPPKVYPGYEFRTQIHPIVLTVTIKRIDYLIH